MSVTKLKTGFLLVTASAGLITATLSAHAQFTVHSRPNVFARALVPSNLREIPHKEWAPQGDPNSPAQWHHTEFVSDDKQVTFSVDTYSNSEGKSISKVFNDGLLRRAQGGDHINYSVLKTDWYVISGTNNRGFEFYEKFFALPRVGVTKNSEDYIPRYWVSFDFVYPYDQRKKYDPMVASITRVFDPEPKRIFDSRNSNRVEPTQMLTQDHPMASPIICQRLFKKKDFSATRLSRSGSKLSKTTNNSSIFIKI